MNEFEAIKLEPGETLLRVTGVGQVAIVPETLSMFIAVVTADPEVREAIDANSETMKQVIKAVRDAGVAKKKVKTARLNVTPHFDSSRFGHRAITGYTVRNGVTVKIDGPDSASAVIASAFEAGANEVHGPAFGTNDPQEGLAEARALALADASARAEACARGLGLRINRVLSISESSLSEGRHMALYRNAGGSGGPPIEEGELQRAMNIAAAYALVAA